MMKKKFSELVGLCSLLFAMSSGCNVEEKLPSLENNLAGAVDIATSPSGNLFYVLNSDYERKYNKGSIVIVDPDAAGGPQKISALRTPRMGRSLAVSAAQKLMLVVYADPEARPRGTVEIWDLADEKNPVLTSSNEIACNPLNGVLSDTQPYFAIGCIEGNVYMGKNPRNAAGAPVSIDLVRSYGLEHRAMSFYDAGGKTFLIGFPTDIDAQDFRDDTLADVQSYNVADNTIVSGPNGIPDGFELTESQRRRWQLAAPYKMFIYPVTDEEALSVGPQAPQAGGEQGPYTAFRYVYPGTFTKPTASEKEQHFVYYNLLEADGTGSAIEQVVAANQHRYRTNFWTVKQKEGENKSIFYLSQRGDYGSESNNVLRVVINDAALLANQTSTFEQMFQVSRIYGFAIDRDNSGRFPCDFEITDVKGEPMLLINSFRDLFYFSNAPFYSLTRKLLNGPDVDHEVPSSRNSNNFRESYYELAVSKSGKVLTSSFYGNVLYLFDASPSASIREQTPILIE